MNSTVAGAILGVSGTVAVGVAGFWATVRTTGKTLRAARDEKVWDKRAEAYADAIGAVSYRQQKREHDLRADLPARPPN